ncbi:hypothetical protein BB934_45160 (plasmid) [Microvirga ossetica]|uniref:Uncharacterized protein n=1 Tax=Microvirga ossetica TaxID=1882682 RepID=A0A1B2EZL4_9HYPH|nr:hypothetical protein [Microvirga ossetica]ANY85411.1 hypothetical protein BB934_45160 [Microvirga ossetica]
MSIRCLMVAAVLAAATPALAQEARDPWDGDWAGDCGEDAYCELQVRKLARNTYEVDYVLTRRSNQTEACRIDGVVARTKGNRLSGKLGRSLAVEVVKHETDTDLVLSVSGFFGQPCDHPKRVNQSYRWFLDE